VITISTGDTLSGLAIRYGTTVRTLQALNGMGRSTLIYAGAVLRVPAHGHRHVGRVSRTPAGTAIAFARAQLSKPYVWGGTGPVGFDCSGLVMRAWQAAGVTLPRTTYDQVNAGTRITRGQLLPGDLVFTNNDGHVQLYIGSGRVIQAPHTGAVVRVSPLAPGTQVDAYVRVRS
jgi:cell wall-associated NlpC family hydrolase